MNVIYASVSPQVFRYLEKLDMKNKEEKEYF
jgi:hypothetical protein